MVHQTVGSMSGGEKARLVLAMIVWQRPNLLLLDEPTNHLDLTTREALALALNEFEGAVMLVSHDRALIRLVCDEFWLVGQGGVRPFDGDLDDYQRYLLERVQQRRETEPEQGTAAFASPKMDVSLSAGELRRQQAAQRQQYLNQRRPLQKQVQQIENDMARLTAEKAELESKLCQPLPADAIAVAGKQLKTVQQILEAAEERWLEASASLESLDQSTMR